MFLKRSLFLIIFLSFLFFFQSQAQNIQYPYPVKYITINIDEQSTKMAYMDVKPESPNGQSVILFHGKNFTGIYWKDVIAFLSNAGYRVIAPDQIGWGLSTKPNTKFTFEMLAQNNKLLLDSLQIDKVNIIGHSMGGMLAARFALMFPERTAKLILEDPLGLEDYKKFIPYKTMEQQYKKELSATYASYKKYQQTYYPVWEPQYEKYVIAQAEPLKQKDFSSVAWINALTYQMIYEQPVLYDLNKLKVPTLLLVGELDRTIPGKEMLTAKKQKLYGNFPALATKAAKKIKNSKVIILHGVGHIPHIQSIDLFQKNVLVFLMQ
jgi:Predicted hydrolases or acyltransferases (alpha/beta hydrolase superfamily)